MRWISPHRALVSAACWILLAACVTAGFCKIKAGTYATKTGRNPGSGPHRVMISGCDGVPYQSRMGEIVEDHPMGKQMFPTYLIIIDVPEKSGTVFDFAVPMTP